MSTYSKSKEQEVQEYLTFKQKIELPLNSLRILTMMPNFENLHFHDSIKEVLKDNEDFLANLKKIADCKEHVRGEEIDTGWGHGKDYYAYYCIHCDICLHDDWR